MTTHYRSLTIADLPNCYFKERLTELANSDTARIFVVAVEGHIDDWAAYVGWPLPHELADQTNPNHLYYALSTHYPDQVAETGDKLPEAVARQIFPYIQKVYRD